MFIVHMRDGRTLKETEVDWKNVDRQNITSLQLLRNGKYYTVSVDGGGVQLLQLKRGTVGMMINESVTERVIGFIVDDKYAVKMEVDEKTSNVRLTLEKRDAKGRWRRM